MEDLMEQANEIQESMGRSYGVPDELDEADLEAGASFLHRSRPLVLRRSSPFSRSCISLPRRVCRSTQNDG